LATNDKRKILSELSKIDKFNTPRIDGQMISNMLRFVYFFGLKKGELIGLNVGDVTGKGGVVPETIRIRGNEFPVTDEIKSLIQDHYQFLGKKGCKRYRSSILFPLEEYKKKEDFKKDRSSPLFPPKEYKRYNGRTLSRHMKEALKNTGLGSLNMEDFRKIGIRRILIECRSEGIDERICRRRTKKFSGLKDDRQLDNVLKEARAIMGKIKDPYQEHLEEIQITSKYLDDDTYNQKDLVIKRIKSLVKKIQDDSGLSESEKDDLISKIPPGIE